MNSPRALANHARYLATIQLDGWATALASDDRPGWVVDAAFAPALQLHLQAAYGWLLLAAARVTAPPPTPPRCVAELPSLAKGLTLPAEVQHCAELERSGWLAELLTPMPTRPQPRKPAVGVLASTAMVPDLDAARRWCLALDELVLAVDHAIDES